MMLMYNKQKKECVSCFSSHLIASKEEEEKKGKSPIMEKVTSWFVAHLTK